MPVSRRTPPAQASVCRSRSVNSGSCALATSSTVRMSPARLARAANMPKAPTPSAITSSGMPSTGAPQTKAAPVARASRTNSASVRGPMGAGLPWGLRVKRGRGSGDSAAAGGLVVETSERVVLGGGGLAREVHQVAHLADALDMLRAANEHLDL